MSHPTGPGLARLASSIPARRWLAASCVQKGRTELPGVRGDDLPGGSRDRSGLVWSGSSLCACMREEGQTTRHRPIPRSRPPPPPSIGGVATAYRSTYRGTYPQCRRRRRRCWHVMPCSENAAHPVIITIIIIAIRDKMLRSPDTSTRYPTTTQYATRDPHHLRALGGRAMTMHS